MHSALIILEQVASQIGKPYLDLETEDLHEIEQLSVEDDHVEDLYILKLMPKLRKLELIDTEVTDLSPLYHLPRLERLTIRSSAIPEDEIHAFQEEKPECEVLR